MLALREMRQCKAAVSVTCFLAHTVTDFAELGNSGYQIYLALKCKFKNLKKLFWQFSEKVNKSMTVATIKTVGREKNQTIIFYSVCTTEWGEEMKN